MIRRLAILAALVGGLAGAGINAAGAAPAPTATIPANVSPNVCWVVVTLTPPHGLCIQNGPPVIL